MGLRRISLRGYVAVVGTISLNLAVGCSLSSCDSWFLAGIAPGAGGDPNRCGRVVPWRALVEDVLRRLRCGWGAGRVFILWAPALWKLDWSVHLFNIG